MRSIRETIALGRDYHPPANPQEPVGRQKPRQPPPPRRQPESHAVEFRNSFHPPQPTLLPCCFSVLVLGVRASWKLTHVVHSLVVQHVNQPDLRGIKPFHGHVLQQLEERETLVLSRGIPFRQAHLHQQRRPVAVGRIPEGLP